MRVPRKVVLFSVALVSLWVVARFLPLEPIFESAPPVKSEKEAKAQAFQTPISSYEKAEVIILERPLFHADRKPFRPPLVVKKEVVPTVKVSPPKIMGMLTNRKGVRFAYLSFPGEKNVEKIKVGESHGLWHLKQMTNTEVVLTHKDKEYVLKLKDAQKKR